MIDLNRVEEFQPTETENIYFFVDSGDVFIEAITGNGSISDEANLDYLIEGVISQNIRTGHYVMKNATITYFDVGWESPDYEAELDYDLIRPATLLEKFEFARPDIRFGFLEQIWLILTSKPFLKMFFPT